MPPSCNGSAASRIARRAEALDPNPYAPPKARVDGVAVTDPTAVAQYGQLYSTSQIFVGTFLGSPLAGTWLLVKNLDVLGRGGEVAKSWGIGIGATALLLTLAFFLPENFPNSVLPLAAGFGFRALAEGMFGAALGSHKSAGGRFFSWWRVVGIGLLFATALLAAVFIGVFFFMADELGVSGVPVEPN